MRSCSEIFCCFQMSFFHFSASEFLAFKGCFEKTGVSCFFLRFEQRLDAGEFGPAPFCRFFKQNQDVGLVFRHSAVCHWQTLFFYFLAFPFHPKKHCRELLKSLRRTMFLPPTRPETAPFFFLLLFSLGAAFHSPFSQGKATNGSLEAPSSLRTAVRLLRRTVFRTVFSLFSIVRCRFGTNLVGKPWRNPAGIFLPCSVLLLGLSGATPRSHVLSIFLLLLSSVEKSGPTFYVMISLLG